MLMAFRVFGVMFAAAWTLPASAQGMSAKFDCDTAAGAFSELAFSQPGPTYHISGSLTAKQYRFDDQWIPVANVRIVSADKQTFGGIRLQAPSGSGRLELVVQSKVQGKDYGAVVGSFGKGEAATFSIDVENSKMTIRVAGKTFAGPDMAAGSGVSVTCSSGQFLFEKLNWETQRSN